MSNDISKVVVMNGLRLCKEAKCRLCPYGDGNGCMKQLISDAYDLGYELLSVIEEFNSEAEPNNVKCKDCEYLMFSDCYGECSKGFFKGIVYPNDSCGKGKKKGCEDSYRQPCKRNDGGKK